ncbi:hypothetical protein ABDD95_01395 [Mucilaginibacter sp. PAMB04274]|uniref:hypothetical protein n=1 Tax=Mucilaginibacter sp. PAMB04274 TaxID=3138568 RepID=UPI0031F6552E
MAGSAYGQARSSLGFTLGVNKTFHEYDNQLHPGISLLGNIRVLNKWAVEPAISVHEVNEYVSARISAKYYITNRAFITAGPFFWVGNDFYNGVGTTASAGYRVFNKPNYNFELSVHGNFDKFSYNSKPIAGLRAAYNFHFRKQ